ncbi:16S rRNA (guanine(966)-N(2))-methyltransferase RsmD [Clostridium polynesiense]|uniref:16S rRNA (guanine(966)-N(2))-methyltransferase RsmD n=1 Tax=Clostridium polynesiense TaxID=1325933 RepID=UPI00058B48B6|nr:16S rRNA (guanine(966)-N(2))-methyltransferase RsmD [Clostridium polynesiense]
MRIISGKAKGRKLFSPPTSETRPTLDRVKESMFSIIQGYIPEAIVLDMFSGTGSLGLEAASRGAKECHLIDKSSTTYPYLKQNIDHLKFNDFCFSYNTDAYSALKKFSNMNKVFDVIFIDPPYLKNMIPEAIQFIYKNQLLDKDGIIVTKIDSSEDIYEGINELMLSNKRKYGNTTVCFYKYEEEQ